MSPVIKRKKTWAAIVVLAGLLAGGSVLYWVRYAGPPDLRVVDEDGKPVSGAEVQWITLSTNLRTTTDDRGESRKPWSLQKINWVLVSHAGFQRSAVVDFGQPRPMIVELQRARPRNRARSDVKQPPQGPPATTNGMIRPNPTTGKQP